MNYHLQSRTAAFWLAAGATLFCLTSFAADTGADGLLGGIPFGPQQVISTQADSALSVFAADLDGDGDVDVLSASFFDDKIAWYENTDGAGTFGAQQVISTLANGAFAVFAADLDGDGDIDVLSASRDDDKIAWYENTDGAGTFGAQQVISTQTDGAYSVFAADVDGDGDLDVLSASLTDDKIAWYENTDGAGAFGAQQVITTLADGALSVFATDLDGDGDVDVLSASSFDDKIAWYENTDGAGSFGVEQVISTLADSPYTVSAADLDGDGDIDVLSASISDDKIAWYENTDGAGTFGAQQVISTLADSAYSVFAADLDGDSDIDVLSASAFDDKIAWYENTDGAGTFGAQQVISTLANGAWSVFASDVDGDGDSDVLSASQNDDKIAWYKNETSALADTDEDGIADVSDNCLLVSNIDQRDTDDDGIGNACDMDLDNNCVVNFLDLVQFQGVFLTNDENADTNGDGNVNFIDFLVLTGAFLGEPGPSGIATICDAGG